MKYWFLWLLAGIVSLVGGIFALINPFAATLTAEQLAGWMFLFVGILTLVSVFNDSTWGARALSILLGLALTFLGVDLLAHPLSGIMSLTIAVGSLLFIAGILRIVIGFSSVSSRIRLVMILSGIVSILLALSIYANFPLSAVVVLGVFLAVELISNGISLIVLSLSRKEDVIVV